MKTSAKADGLTVEASVRSDDQTVPNASDDLKRKYESVLKEPIPPRLVALIHRLRMVEKSRDL